MAKRINTKNNQHQHRGINHINTVLELSLGGSIKEKEKRLHHNKISTVMAKCEASSEKDEPSVQIFKPSESNVLPELQNKKDMKKIYSRDKNVEDGSKPKSGDKEYAENFLPALQILT